MKKQLNSTEETVGQTVDGMVFDGSIGAISFRNDTFIMFEVELGYDDITSMVVNTYPAEPNHYLVDAGACTQEECDKYYGELRERDAKERDERERKLYKKLKARYEGKE